MVSADGVTLPAVPGLVAVVFLCDKLTANINTDFVNGLIIDLLDMKTVVDHMSVVKHFRGYEHH